MPWPAREIARAALIAAGCGAFAGAPSVAHAGTEVALELVLAVDSSGSVDAAEFDLQLRGLSNAFRDRDVVAAIEASGAGGIAVAVVQWAGPGHQLVVVDWMHVRDEATAADFALRIELAGRRMFGETAIGPVLNFALGMLLTNDYVGRRRVIDVSGDGETNFGKDPDLVRDRVVATGATINGLAILNEFPRLDRYYRQHVIGGDGAFVMSVADYNDFAAAMRAKLIQEILGGPVVWAPSPVVVCGDGHVSAIPAFT